MVTQLGRVVRKPVNANPGSKVNRSIHFSCIKMFFIVPNGRDSSKNVEIFKNNTTFLIFTNMFRRYIRHRQCDGFESLQ